MAETKHTAIKKPRTSKKKEEAISKLRIRVMAYEYKILDISVKQIIDTALRYDAKVVGPIPLPVVPILPAPFACSFAISSNLCVGKIK